MFILQINPLRKQLATTGLSAQHAFRYYLATAILSALTYEAIANGPQNPETTVALRHLIEAKDAAVRAVTEG